MKISRFKLIAILLAIFFCIAIYEIIFSQNNNKSISNTVSDQRSVNEEETTSKKNDQEGGSRRRRTRKTTKILSPFVQHHIRTGILGDITDIDGGDGVANNNNNNNNKCLTYEERFHRCLKIYQLSPLERRKLFLLFHHSTTTSSSSSLLFSSTSSSSQQNKQSSTTNEKSSSSSSNRNTLQDEDEEDDSDEEEENYETNHNEKRKREVALLRIHNITWTQDFWLSVCAFIIESPGNIFGHMINSKIVIPTKNTNLITRRRKRDVFLYTLEGHESTVPFEFQPFVRTHLETALSRIFGKSLYIGGYQRGDLAAALFLKLHPQYDFCWLIEYDIRFTSSWEYLFSQSRKFAREQQEGDDLDFYFDNDNNRKEEEEEEENKINKSKNKNKNKKEEDAHLIYFYPPIFNSGYDVSPIITRTPQHQQHLLLRKYELFDFYRAMMKKNLFFEQQEEEGGNIKKKQKQKKSITKKASPNQIQNWWHFSAQHYFRGTWKTKFLSIDDDDDNKNSTSNKNNNKNSSQSRDSSTPKKMLWTGAFIPGFGFSRKLALLVFDTNLKGDGHQNQEVNVPVVAMLNNLKSVSVAGMSFLKTQFYFSWSRRNETAPLYVKWKRNFLLKKKKNADGKLLSSSSSMSELFNVTETRFYGLNTWEFTGKSCLSATLLHPVK